MTALTALATFGGFAAALGGLLGGLVSLRWSWANRARPHGGAIVLGWGLIGLSAAGFVLWRGGEIGLPLFFITLSLLAYGTVLAALQRRGVKSRGTAAAAPDTATIGPDAIDPAHRPKRLARGLLRTAAAFLLAGAAAIGIGVMVATSAPWSDVTRIAVGGLIVPILWAAGMAWTLVDTRILRASILLTGVAALSLGMAFF
ncbi:hypothetical protein [Eilatimonas milleporae]|uniref:Uncharacterized protein n=1 Tax=Eilatimonas milleporae TaxID=911205 RepID=A0A3M0CH84_9PROT|nr:hypothetical protein [Eilatimonas milleporae]RMB08177.1 hypothetical protein BXY39_2273 [Eilatimonas milleporae]